MDWAKNVDQTKEPTWYHSGLDKLTSEYEMIESFINSSLDKIKTVYSKAHENWNS